MLMNLSVGELKPATVPSALAQCALAGALQRLCLAGEPLFHVICGSLRARRVQRRRAGQGLCRAGGGARGGGR